MRYCNSYYNKYNMNDEDGYCIDVLNEEGQEEQEESSILDLKEVPGVLHVDKTFGRKE